LGLIADAVDAEYDILRVTRCRPRKVAFVVRPAVRAWHLVGIVALLVLGFLAHGIWVIFFYNVDYGSWSTSRDVAACTSVPPPAEANDIRVAIMRYDQARNTFVRFRAPVNICLKYAAQVTHNAELKPLDDDQVYSDLSALFSYCNLSRRDLRWFDLPYAQGYWSATKGNVTFRKPDYGNVPAASNIVGVDLHTDSDFPSIRVDVSHGVFYYYTVN
jgi:hypothetical protein